jgi:hypothetical protein
MSNQRKMENPTDATKRPALWVAFDSRLKLELNGSKVTSDAELLAYRELYAALGLTDLGEDLLSDRRIEKMDLQNYRRGRKLKRGPRCSLALVSAGNPGSYA